MAVYTCSGVTIGGLDAASLSAGATVAAGLSAAAGSTAVAVVDISEAAGASAGVAVGGSAGIGAGVWTKPKAGETVSAVAMATTTPRGPDLPRVSFFTDCISLLSWPARCRSEHL